MDGIIFRMRSGCQWNRLPKELGDDSTIHRTFQAVVGVGSAGAHLGGAGGGVWGAGRCGVGVADCRLLLWAKHVLGDSVGRNPTDRGKAGSKRSVLVDGCGGPLSVVVSGANVHNTKLLAITPDSIVAERPDAGIQHLCLDKGIRQPIRPRGRGGIRVPRTHPAHRRGETGRHGRKALSRPALGGGAHPSLAIQVPGNSGPLRQESIKTTSE